MDIQVMDNKAEADALTDYCTELGFKAVKVELAAGGVMVLIYK